MKNNKLYFGTDGIRGKIGDKQGYITPKMMTKLGWAVGKIMLTGLKDREQNQNKSPQMKVMIGKDTRISGYMLESALEAGLISAGVDVYLTGPLPTPAIAYLTKTFSCDIGLAITASHNPYTDNGIKFFSQNGEKLSDDLEIEIESFLSQPSDTNPAHLLGKAFRIDDSAGRYIEFCKSSFPMNLNLEGIKLVIDCSNGATYHIAPEVFKELGAEVIAIHNEPNGLNINDDCGSNCPQSLIAKVKKHQADLGIAFDGDGDRICLIDHLGNIIDGDGVLYILANYLKINNKLKSKFIIGSKMTNLGLEKALKKIDLELVRTDVGDKFIRQKMKELGSNLGGETSGHIICTDYINTGDAIIAALQILKIIKKSGKTLNDLLSNLTLYPNLRKDLTLSKEAFEHKAKLFQSSGLKKLINSVEEKLAGQGRILIRSSGTEPVIRIMIESNCSKKCQELVDWSADQLRLIIEHSIKNSK